jgi:hypothetical protein
MTRLDTLFLSFDPGQSSTRFVGFVAELKVRPLPGDTLGSLWEPASGTSLPMWMKIGWVAPEMDERPGFPSPLRVPGSGGLAYRRAAGGEGIIRMLYAVGTGDSAFVEGGKRYGLARFVMRRPGPGPGCRQPVCIEWSSAVFSWIAGRNLTVEGKGVGVSLNPAPGKGCFGPEPGSPAPKKSARPSGRK